MTPALCKHTPAEVEQMVKLCSDSRVGSGCCAGDGAALGGIVVVAAAVEGAAGDSQAGQVQNAHSTLSSQLCTAVEDFHPAQRLRVFATPPADLSTP